MTSPCKKKASPNKRVGTPKKKASPSKKCSRSAIFSWDKRSTMILLELCLEYQADHGKKQQFKWAQIIKSFEERIGRSVLVGTIRNRMEVLKRQYQLWMRLKGSETGLGVDPVTGKIDADDDWWDKKIKENHEYKRFRDHGVWPDMDEMWSRVFGDTYATGEHCAVPVHADLSPISPTPIDTEQQSTPVASYTPTGENDPDLEEFERTDPLFFRNLHINEGQEGGTSSTAPARESSPSPIGTKRMSNVTSSSPFESPTTNTSGANKRPKLSRTATVFQDAVTELRKEGRLAYDLIGSISAGCAGPSVDKDKLLKDAYVVLYGMVKSGLLERGTELFNFAASRLLDEPGLKGFMYLETDDDRLSWLKYQISKDK